MERTKKDIDQKELAIKIVTDKITEALKPFKKPEQIKIIDQIFTKLKDIK